MTCILHKIKQIICICLPTLNTVNCIQMYYLHLNWTTDHSPQLSHGVSDLNSSHTNKINLNCNQTSRLMCRDIILLNIIESTSTPNDESPECWFSLDFLYLVQMTYSICPLLNIDVVHYCPVLQFTGCYGTFPTGNRNN